MALNLSKTVADYLKQRAEQKFTARQIAEWVFETYPAECQEKMAKSTAIKTDADLKQQLVAEIGSQRPQLQKKYPQIKTTAGRRPTSRRTAARRGGKGPGFRRCRQ